MKRIYSILVENHAGVLCKTAGLFWRRCFNIDSITVGETDDRDVSSMVIVSSGDERTLEQIEKQLKENVHDEAYRPQIVMNGDISMLLKQEDAYA